jgi:ABC-type multidrug transport system fused ATPase/permease subunit
MTVFEIPPLLALGIFALYVLLNGSLSPEIAFTTLSLFNSLRFPLVVLPRALRSVAEARAAIRRLEAFLLTPEMQEQKRGKTPSISIKKADIGYNKEVILKNINMKVPAGSLLGVVGPVGSGKSYVHHICYLLKIYDVTCDLGRGFSD